VGESLLCYDKITNLDRLETTLLELCYKGSGVTDEEFDKIDLARVQAELGAGTFKFAAPKYLTAGSGSERRKYISFELIERLVIRLLYTALSEILEPQFIDNLFSHRKNKSYKHAIINLQESMRLNADGIVVRLDVEKYYDSIDHEILLLALEKYVDKKSVDLVRSLLTVFGNDGKGIFSGSSLSNLFGNLYLSSVDHLVTDALQNPTYIRFVDDMAMVCKDMATAQDLRETIELYLDKKLKLKLSARKSFLRGVSDGCKFLGYDIFPEKLFLLKDYIDSTNEKLDKILCGQSGLTDEQIRNKIRSIKGKLKNTCEIALRDKVEEVDKILRAGGSFLRSRTRNIAASASKEAVQPSSFLKNKGQLASADEKSYEKQEVLSSTNLAQNFKREDHVTQKSDNNLPKIPQTGRVESQIVAEIQNLNMLNLTPWEAFLCVKRWQESIVVLNPE
jgi:hypothetical protein